MKTVITKRKPVSVGEILTEGVGADWASEAIESSSLKPQKHISFMAMKADDR